MPLPFNRSYLQDAKTTKALLLSILRIEGRFAASVGFTIKPIDLQQYVHGFTTLTTTTTTPLPVRHVLIFYDLVSVVIVPCGLRILYWGFFMYDYSCNYSIVSPASPFDVF